MDQLEALLEELRTSHSMAAPALPQPAPDVPLNSEYKLALADGKAHRIEATILEWPRTMWVTCCGWRCGLNAKLKIYNQEKLPKTRSMLDLGHYQKLRLWN